MVYLSLPQISYLALFVVKNRERQTAAPIFGNRGDERVFIRAREQIGRHFRFHFAQKFRHPSVYFFDKIFAACLNSNSALPAFSILIPSITSLYNSPELFEKNCSIPPLYTSPSKIFTE